ncbi:MAG: hypothetical protein ACUVXJ_04010 [Phycisphaerae bacterium]
MSRRAHANRPEPQVPHATRLWLTALSIAALLMALPKPARAQSRPAHVVADRDRAADDSFEHLFEEVGKLRLNTGQELRFVLGRSADDELAVRSVLRQTCQSWHPYRHFRGLLEVDAWMPISALDQTLEGLVQKRLRTVGGPAQMTITWAKSNPPAVLATGQYLPSSSLTNGQLGWRHCGPWQMALAEKAAAVDARAAMLVRMGYCKLSDGHELGFVLHREKKLSLAVSRLLNQAPVGKTLFEPTGVCRVTMKLTRPDLLKLLQDASRAVEGFGRSELFKSADFPVADDIEAEGYAVAPSVPGMYRPPIKKGSEPPRPDWADRFLVVQGAGRAPSDTTDEASRAGWAERAARIEALRQLWMQIEDLPLDDGETVGLRMQKDPRLVSAMSGLDRFIASTGRPLRADDGAVTVNVGVHLQIVWRIASTVERTQ